MRDTLRQQEGGFLSAEHCVDCSGRSVTDSTIPCRLRKRERELGVSLRLSGSLLPRHVPARGLLGRALKR